MPQMHPAGDRMNLAEPPGVPLLDMDVPEKTGFALVTIDPSGFVNGGIGREDHSALTARDDLGWIERERSRDPERPSVAVAVAAAVGMCRVLDQRDASIVTEGPQLGHVRRDQPTDMDQDNGAGPRRHRGLDTAGGQGKGVRTHIRENRHGTGPQHRESGRRKRVRRHDDIRAFDTVTAKDDLQCGCSTAHGDRERGLVSRGECRLEFSGMDAQGQRTGGQDLGRGRCDLRAILR